MGSVRTSHTCYVIESCDVRYEWLTDGVVFYFSDNEHVDVEIETDTEGFDKLAAAVATAKAQRLKELADAGAQLCP